MATTVVMSIGTRANDSVTVNTVTGTNPYTVTLSATVPGTTKISDKITDSAVNLYLITGISGTQLTVKKFPWNAAPAPATGAATLNRAFSSVQAWNNQAPADLTTATVDGTAGGCLYKGECWNDSELVSAARVDINGSTTSATCFKWLTAAATQSFADHASKLTNALKYNQANGAAIRVTTNFQAGIAVNDSFTKIERLQIQGPLQPGASSDGVITINSAVSSISLLGNIIQSSLGYYEPAVNCNFSNGNIITNNLILWQGLTGTVHGWAILGADTAQIHNNTIVCVSDKTAPAGIHANGSTNGILINNAIYGFTAATSGTFSSSSSYTSTDASAAPGTVGNLINQTYASQFQATTSSAPDFKALATGGLDGGGIRDQTYTLDLDIIGQARSTTTPNIGAWENVSTAANFNVLGRSRIGLTGKTVTTTTAGTRHVIITLVDNAGALAINRTNLKVQWWDGPPNTVPAGSVVNYTATGTTNASGVLDFPIPASSLTTGQIGTLSVTNSDGTITQSPVGVSFYGPWTVT